MKIVRKHLKLNRELMYEYLRINTELFNQEKITCLNNEIRSIYDDNESEFNEIVLNISDNNMKLRVFLMDIYVNGFKNISLVLRQNRNIKDEKNLSELDKQYLNMEHGIRTICRDIEAYLFVNYKIKLSEIDYNKYNISQKYFGSFELSKPTESNATKKEPQQEKERLKEQLFEMQNNLIPKVSIENVYNYFEILTTSKNKKNEFYLTEKQLLIFIKSSFVDLKPIKQHFNGKPQFKKDVRSLFFRFYDKCSQFEYNATGKKNKHFYLMFNSFHGFDEEKDRDEWHKTNSTLIGKNITNRPNN